MRAVVFIAVCLSPLGAQSPFGQLTGRVADATGAGLGGARVAVKNMETAFSLTAVAASDGQYRFDFLPVGQYQIEATADGFQAAARRNLGIEAGRTATLNLTLAVGPMQLTVEVAEAGATIDTTSARVQTGFGERQMVELPITGVGQLGVLNLSLLSAGVTSSGGVGYGTGPAIGGQRPTNNAFTVDGVDNNNRAITGPVLLVPNEAVAELSLQQNQYGPEYGHSSGGQFHVLTKSGTNEFRGTAYQYHQNRRLNAVDEAFARQGIREPPRYDQNRFGANAGGALVKDKLFAFGNLETRPLGQASVTNAALLAPTAEGWRTLESMGGLSRTNLEQFRLYVPPAPEASRSALVGEREIPLGVIRTEAPVYQNFVSAVGSVDHTLSARDHLRGSYLFQRESGPQTQTDLPAFFTRYGNRAQLAALTHHHVFRPALTNELRAGYHRLAQEFPDGGFRYPGLDRFPTIGLVELGLQIGPAAALPQAGRNNVYQLANNLTWARGRSVWKFGYDGRQQIGSTFFTPSERGDYTYDTLERFLRDLPPEQGQRSTGGSPYSGNLRTHYLFANNDWRIRRTLTMNLGWRYEYAGVPASARQQSLNALASVPGLIEFREPRAGKRDFAPRVGLAWSPGQSGKTSIRAGFGMNYDQIYQNLGINTLPPQFFTTVVVETGAAAAPGFLANGGIAPTASRAAWTAEEARTATASFVPDQARPYSLQWNGGLQRVLARDYTMELRYLGSRGVRLPLQTRLNRPAAVTSPERGLPLFFSRPSAAELDALPLTREDLKAPADPLQKAGFTNVLSAFLPVGNSSYHGLAAQASKRFGQGLMFTAAYTWSHNIDDSTATLNTTVLTPRRPEDFFNLRRERASSALDHRQRLTLSWYWETPWMRRQENAWLRALLADWTFSGAFMAETGSWATPRSGVDANLNGDAAGDRTVVNPLGDRKTASAVAPLCRSAVLPIDCSQKKPPKSLVGYLVLNPEARYIQAAEGVYANGGRNTFRLPGINNFDVAVGKRVRMGERRMVEVRAEAYNALNHAQYTAGFPNVANSRARAGVSDSLLMQAASPGFGRADQAFQSNARAVQLVARFVF